MSAPTASVNGNESTLLYNTTPPDFGGLDPEQVRLMGEQLIVLDRDDQPVGTASKSVCQLRYFTSFTTF